MRKVVLAAAIALATPSVALGQAGPPSPTDPNYLKPLVKQRAGVVLFKAQQDVTASIVLPTPIGKMPFPNGNWVYGAIDTVRCCSVSKSGQVRASARVAIGWRTTPWTQFGPCWNAAVKDYGFLHAHDSKLLNCTRKVFAWFDARVGKPKYNALPWQYNNKFM